MGNKILLIGLDLSFNSTGISFCKVTDNIPETIKFYRVGYTESTNNVTPKHIPNVNQILYRMPSNVNAEDLLLTKNSKNDAEQVYATIRSMICAKKVNSILATILEDVRLEVSRKDSEQLTIICTIENYIMPAFAGPNSLRNVSGLILLQGYIREFLIRYKLTYPDVTLLLHTPTPTQNKKNFTGDGKADKQKMLETFLNFHDGSKLLPNTSKGKLDDVIDAYSLMIYGWKLWLSNIVKNK